mmetsp:Transcript_5197/g.18562  ORF Transcript_5197/g.18562 Transcript_5197/m.18562 type:complete len:205 (+) Transcript_5197:595-1209(+)
MEPDVRSSDGRSSPELTVDVMLSPPAISDQLLLGCQELLPGSLLLSLLLVLSADFIDVLGYPAGGDEHGVLSLRVLDDGVKGLFEDKIEMRRGSAELFNHHDRIPHVDLGGDVDSSFCTDLLQSLTLSHLIQSLHVSCPLVKPLSLEPPPLLLLLYLQLFPLPPLVVVLPMLHRILETRAFGVVVDAERDFVGRQARFEYFDAS